MPHLLERFANFTARRRLVGMRLQRILELLAGVGQVARIIVFGSFVTNKADPNDVDLFLVMEDSFDVSAVAGEARLLFDHGSAQPHFGASVFWVRRIACYPDEAEMVSEWSLKRDGNARGIVEITKETP
jgi:predicted nucleotidyltransferase